MTLTLVLATLILTAAAHAKRPSTQLKLSQTIVSVWTCETQRGLDRTPAPNPWKPNSEGWRRVQLNTWVLKRKACLAVLTEIKRQWNWQAWLPDKWARIGACETGYGQRPGNWQHNSGPYQGAFGFAVSSWDQFKLAGYPSEAYQATPWQQYQVALAIWRRYGFSGWGCRGA